MITDPIEKALPARINRLYELAHNLWWSWHPNAVWLFKYLDKTLWELTYQNPLRLLAKSLEFIDPVSGLRRQFESLRRLDFESASLDL